MAFHKVGNLPYVGDVYPEISKEALAGSMKGKIVVLLGAGRGLGRHMAISFAAAGASVALAARSVPEIEEVAKILRDQYDTKCITVKTDALSTEDLENLVKRTEAELGPIDVAIANAGANYMYAMTEDVFDPELWWKGEQLNIKTPMLFSRLVFPSMIKRKTGIIVLVSSIGSTFPAGKATSCYGVGKCAMNRLAECLHAELSQYGIQAFAIQPCTAKTTFGTGRSHPIPEEFTMLRALDEDPDGILTDSPDLAGQSMVYLATGKMKSMSGHFLNFNQPLPQCLEKFESLSAEEQKGVYYQRIKML